MRLREVVIFSETQDSGVKAKIPTHSFDHGSLSHQESYREELPLKPDLVLGGCSPGSFSGGAVCCFHLVPLDYKMFLHSGQLRTNAEHIFFFPGGIFGAEKAASCSS